MPEDKTIEGLPIFKKEATHTEDGLPILKKKSILNSPSPSELTPGQSPLPLVSEGGTSELTNTPSVLQSEQSHSEGRFNFATGKNDLPILQKETPLPETAKSEDDLLRATGTSQEINPTDQSKSLSPEALKEGFKQPELAESFMRGAARLGSSLAKSPAFIYDMAVHSDPIFSDASKLMGVNSSKELSEKLGLPENTLAKDLDKVVSDSQEDFSKKYDKGISEYFEKGDYDKAFDLLANNVAESAPAMISIAMGNAAGVGMLGTTAAGSVVFGADKKSQLDKENPDMSEEAKTANAFLTGTLEGATEALPIHMIGNVAKSIFAKQGAQAATDFAKKGFIKTYGKTIGKYLGAQATEALSEGANQLGENIVDKYSGKDPNIDITKGIKDAMIVGLGAGVAMSGPITAMHYAKTKTAALNAANIQEQKVSLEQDIQSPDVSAEAKNIISNKIKDLNEQDANLAQDEKSNFESLPEEKKTEVDSLLSKTKDIHDAVLDPNISEGTREILTKDLDAAENSIEKIYEDHKNTKAEEENDFKTHEDWLRSFEEEIKPKEENKLQDTEIPATEMGLVNGEAKSEPIDITNLQNTEQHEGEILQREQEKTASQRGERKRVESSEQRQEVASEVPKEEKVAKEKLSNELIDENEQLEAKKEDDVESVNKLNDDIEVLKKFDKSEVAKKKFSAIIERAFKMKEEGKISKPTYTKYRNIAQQVLGPKVSIDAEQAKFQIEGIKETIKKKLLGEGYKKVLMSAPGFGPKQVADLIDITTAAAKKAIDAGFAVKEAVEKALKHIKTHPYYEKLIKEGHLDEKSFSGAVKEAFTQVKEETEPAPKKENATEKAQPKTELSGIKKALVSDEIIRGVDLEKISDKEMQGLAKEIIDTGEIKPESIVNEVLKKHRALQPKEVVALIYYKTQLDNELRSAYEEKNKLLQEGESTGPADEKIVDLEQKRENFDEVSVITASQQSLAFRLRKGMRDSDFNLVSQIAKYKATNNGEISPKVEEKMRDLDKRYREALEKVDKLEREAEENEIEKAHRNIIEDVTREGQVGKNKTYTQKSKELADKVRKLKNKPFTFITADGKKVDIQQQGLSMNAIIELAARTIETTGKVLDGVNAAIKEFKKQEWYKKLSDKDQKAVNQQVNDYFGNDEKEVAKPHINDEGAFVIPHSLIREIYKSGITDINGIVKEVKEKLGDIEGVTDRNIRDAITRYGKMVNLSKDEVEKGIRQAKRIGKLISQLEDIRKNERPKRSGLQRDKPSDEERRIMKEVKREMKNLPQDPEEDARALKSALDATKTRLKNRIADLENQLATGEKTPKTKGVDLDAEAKSLKEKVEKLRAELEAIEGKPKISDEQRLARMKTYTKNRIADLEAKITNKDFSKPEKNKPISDTELTKARADLMERKDEWEKLQYENELRNRSKWEKRRHIFMGALNTPRAFKLGFDLSAIGVQGMRRLSTSPIQSAKAFKNMMEQTFSEKAQKEWLKNLKGQEWYPTLKASGAAFTDTDGKISVREENFSNDLVKRAFKFLFNEKLGLDKINPYEASNRAFSGYLNSIRLQGYLEGFKSLERKGKTFESHPQDYKSWVKYINNITGRGSLGKKGNSSELAQFIFTSPRKMISEANLINPHFWGNIVKKDVGKDYNYQLTPTVARKAFGDFSLGMGITAIAAALARAAFAHKDDKKDKDFTDPKSSNFMGVKIRDEHGGFTVVHPFAAYKTEAVLISRLLSGKMTNTRTGKTAPLGKQPGTKGTDLIVSFLANKFSPTFQIPWKYYKQGDKYDAKAEALKVIEPATLEGFMQSYKDYPTETETTLTALAFLGLSETHIETKKAKK